MSAEVVLRAPRSGSDRIAGAGSSALRLLPGAAACAVVGGLGDANGGYFPTAWGWCAVALLWLTTTAVVVGRGLRPGRLETLVLAGLLGLVGWAALSTFWSTAARALPEADRTLVYAAGAAALLLLVRAEDVAQLLGGVLGAIAAVSSYALGTRLFPDHLGSYDPVGRYRLSEPLGYWNGLGLFAALGTLLALGFAARARTPAARSFAAASVVVLAPTVYFTFSRGAWAALGIGLVVAVALDRRRPQLVTTLLALAAPAGLAVWLSSRSDALTRRLSAAGAAARDGHRLAGAIAALALLAAGLALLAAYLEPRFGRGHRVYVAVLVLALAGAIGAATVRLGSPVTAGRRAYASFTAPPSRPGADLNQRLLSFSGSGRWLLWTAAWRDYESHPWLGSGAGTFEPYWLRHRPTRLKVRDAHSLYLETLAELGPLGLLLLLAALGSSLLAAVKARRHPLAAPAAGAYAAYLAAAGIDWDWGLTSVTLAALACGAAVLAARRHGTPLRPLPRRAALVTVTAGLTLLPFALVGLAGARALSAGAAAASAGRWTDAAEAGREAARWAPWSSDAWRLAGEAQLAGGHSREARSSFRRALAEDPGDWSAWLDLAGASRGAALRRALAEAARLNPRSPEIAEFRRDFTRSRNERSST